ncbi:MAG TPA: ornithine carbamoyltransferase [Phycisphaerae bacterium]|nr:ornithine carbamoyltransferase [Phycisphaerae bacterium]
MQKNFINLRDFTAGQLGKLLDRAIAEKTLFAQGKLPATLQRRTLAMIFEKPSLRTRVSFEAAMTHLGGHAIYLTREDIGLGSREAVQDIARVLGRLCDGIMARTFSHRFVEDLGRYTTVPVVNALTDYSHPCQAMADLMTVREHFGELAGRKLVFVGDGNNVARSLAEAGRMLGVHVVLACPKGYELEDEFVASLESIEGAGSFATCNDPAGAVADADVIYTDTWVSMGQEAEKEKRVRDFAAFQVNPALLAQAPARAIVLHCLPAYRGFEIDDDAFEAHAQTILAEAENRLHFQRALLNALIGDGGI